MTPDTTRKPRPRLSLFLAIATTVIVGGCGSTPSEATHTPPQTHSMNPQLNGLLPEDIRTAGEVRVVASVGVPPLQFLADDGQTIIGLEPSVAEALGQILGVTFTLTNINFDGVLAGMESQRFDMAMAAMLDTRERQAKFDFVDYADSGFAIGVPTGNPKNIQGTDGLCGNKVAVEKASAGESLTDQVSKSCTEQGKLAIQIQPLPDFTSVLQSLASGRADAAVGGIPVFDYISDQLDIAIELVPGNPFGLATLGFAFSKADTALRDAVKGALDTLVDSGDFARMCEQWKAASACLDKIRINEPTQ